MLLKKFWSNIHGMSLTEIMVAMGLLGGISLVSMKAMQDQAGNEAYLKWTAAVNKAAMDIQTVVNNTNRCNEMLVGWIRESQSFPNLSPATFANKGVKLQIATGTGINDKQILLQNDTEYAEGFYIPNDGIRLATSPNGAGISELVLTFQTRSRAKQKNRANITDMTATDRNVIIKRIPFVTTMTGTQVKSCGPVVSDEDLKAKEMMCRSLGGAANWSGGVCTLNEVKCPDGQVPTQMTSLGSFTCTPVSNAAMRDQLFDFSTTTCPAGQGVTLIVAPGGKIKAGCTSTTSGCPAMATVTWYGTTTAAKAQCTADAGIGAGTSPSTVTLNDTVSSITSPGTGSATYSCDAVKKTWVLTGTPSCFDRSMDCAAGVTVYWSGATKFCNGPSATAVRSGQTSTATSTAGGSGTATIECVDKKWSIIGTPTCN